MVLDFCSRKHNPERNRMRKPWKWILLDSALIAGIAFIARLPEAWPCLLDLYSASKAFGYALLIQVAIERGLRR